MDQVQTGVTVHGHATQAIIPPSLYVLPAQINQPTQITQGILFLVPTAHGYAMQAIMPLLPNVFPAQLEHIPPEAKQHAHLAHLALTKTPQAAAPAKPASSAARGTTNPVAAGRIRARVSFALIKSQKNLQ